MECSKKKINPRESANIFSLLTFCYSLPIFLKGFRKGIDDEDLYEVIDSCRSKKCGDNTDDQWKNSLSIYTLLWRRFGRRYVTLGLINIAWGQINSIFQPYGMSRLISYFDKSQTTITKTDAYYSAAIVIFLTLSSFVFTHNFRIIEFNFAVKMQTSLKSLMYRKILRLSPESLSHANLGNIVTILTKDIYTIESSSWLVMDILNYAAKTVTVSYLLWSTLGNSAFIGLGLVFVALPLQTYLSTFLTKMRLQVGKKADERLHVMQETLSAIKIIKMYTWEHFFIKKVSKARSKEIIVMMKASYLAVIITLIGMITSKLTFIVLILSYIWIGGVTTTELLFYTFSLFNEIGMSLSVMIPGNICRIAHFRASFIRLNSLLQSKELEVNRKGDISSAQPKNMTSHKDVNLVVNDKVEERNQGKKDLESAKIKPLVEFKNVAIVIKDKEILKDIDIKISPGLTVVSGAIASGKSSLLRAILKEIPASQGHVKVDGTLAYASQESWLFPASIKQNILLGEKYEPTRYAEVVRTEV